MSFGKRKIAVITTAVAVLGGIAAGAAVAAGAGGGDDATETPISGAALEQAKAAALAQTGGGRVTGTEVGDEESYYEVEVTLANGDQVDVQLDENFDVVGSEGDGPETGDEGAEG